MTIVARVRADALGPDLASRLIENDAWVTAATADPDTMNNLANARRR